MKTGITKWFGQKVFTLATEENVKAMHLAALFVVKDVKTHFTGGTAADVAALKERRAAGAKVQKGGVSPRSKPGQPPAIQTGILKASIMSDVQVEGSNVIGRVGPDIEHIAAKAAVGTDVNYGLYLEVGTRNISPRPFLRPALKRTKNKVNTIFKRANK